MSTDKQAFEVDQNYDAFQRLLSDILDQHRDEYALMRDRKIVGYFKNPGDANVAGVEMFADDIFSIQEVTDEPIDLGFWSHVAVH